MRASKHTSKDSNKKNDGGGFVGVGKVADGSDLRHGPAGTDKTLVSWVCLANTTQQGGSALTIQRGDPFDGIVFGEKEAGKWMAGSDGSRAPRTTSGPSSRERRREDADPDGHCL